MSENIIENDENFEAFIRAFWSRIKPFKNDYGKELPDKLPIEFRAHMATAALALKLDGVTEKEAERWASRLNWLHTEYCADCSGCDSGDLLDGVEAEMRQVINTLSDKNADLREEVDATDRNMEALTELFDEVVKERDAQKQVRSDYAGIIHNMVVSLQSAWIEWQHGEGAEKAMIHIHNMLDGPGQIPDENDPYGKDSEMYYAANRHDPYPVCFCGKPSVIACGDKGYCCEEHFNQGEGE